MSSAEERSGAASEFHARLRNRWWRLFHQFYNASLGNEDSSVLDSLLPRNALKRDGESFLIKVQMEFHDIPLCVVSCPAWKSYRRHCWAEEDDGWLIVYYYLAEDSHNSLSLMAGNRNSIRMEYNYYICLIDPSGASFVVDTVIKPSRWYLRSSFKGLGTTFCAMSLSPYSMVLWRRIKVYRTVL